MGSKAQLEDTVARIMDIGRKLGKPVIATGNVHYLHPRDKISRDITIHGITGFSPLKDIRKPDAHLRTTDEMLREFQFLGADTAFEVVVTNTNGLADQFEEIELFPQKLFTPIIDGADDEIRSTCYNTAKSIYGENLPEVVTARLEKRIGADHQIRFLRQLSHFRAFGEKNRTRTDTWSVRGVPSVPPL